MLQCTALFFLHFIIADKIQYVARGKVRGGW